LILNHLVQVETPEVGLPFDGICGEEVEEEANLSLTFSFCKVFLTRNCNPILNNRKPESHLLNESVEITTTRDLPEQTEESVESRRRNAKTQIFVFASRFLRSASLL